eukprot:scaffold34966_cov30-Tisochrysis_lutea.AAC.1
MKTDPSARGDPSGGGEERASSCSIPPGAECEPASRPPSKHSEHTRAPACDGRGSASQGGSAGGSRGSSGRPDPQVAEAWPADGSSAQAEARRAKGAESGGCALRVHLAASRPARKPQTPAREVALRRSPSPPPATAAGRTHCPLPPPLPYLLFLSSLPSFTSHEP